MMDEEQKSLLIKSADQFPIPPGLRFSYGTAGFRADSLILESTVFRAGILAALRSLKTRSMIGLMITASHNEISDNGVKFADPDGSMLTHQWEPFADDLANAPNSGRLLQLIVDFAKKEEIPFDGTYRAEILVGRDTRPSGEHLLEASKYGINSVAGSIAIDQGVVTTPQLHWMVRARNKGQKASELDYFEQLSSNFRCLMNLLPIGGMIGIVDDKLVVDGANGVGGEKLEKLMKMLGNFEVEVRNTGKDGGILNEGVGADFVQKAKAVPQGFGPDDVGKRCASLDGDGDRFVYFMVPSLSSNSDKVSLVDGDKILTLFALFIKEQLFILIKDDETDSYKPRVGAVQTAYANGASTDYLRGLGLEIVFTSTGVKYLHEKAYEYDIGIYFEANGHGTIVFSEKYISWLEHKNKELSSTSEGSEKQKATLRLLAVSKLINQAVGDALSGLLLVEAILQHMGWSIHRWSELYHDFPSKQLKVKILDRTTLVTTNAETVVVSPPGIQKAIDAETAKYPHGRCFIRPSGTEDVIRIYAEASTQDAADSLADSVAELVDKSFGLGVTTT